MPPSGSYLTCMYRASRGPSAAPQSLLSLQVLLWLPCPPWPTQRLAFSMAGLLGSAWVPTACTGAWKFSPEAGAAAGPVSFVRISQESLSFVACGQKGESVPPIPSWLEAPEISLSSMGWKSPLNEPPVISYIRDFFCVCGWGPKTPPCPMHRTLGA